METGELLLRLKEYLPANQIGDVARSIHQDSLLREAVNRGDFLATFAEYAGSNPTHWNIGQFCLYSIDYPEPDNIAREPLAPLPSEVRQQTSTSYQKTAKSETPPVTLSEAGLLALALRERFRLTGSWSGMVDEITRANTTHQFSPSCWKTPFSIIYSWFGQSPDLLNEFKSISAHTTEKEYYPFISAIILTQVLPFESLLKTFISANAGEELRHLVSWLHYLRTIHPQLARALASDFIDNSQLGSQGENSPAYNDYLHSLAVNSRYSDPLVDEAYDPDFSTIDLWLNLYELAGADDQYSALLNHKNSLLQGLLARIQANQLRKTSPQKGINPWIDLSYKLSTSALATAEMILAGLPEGTYLMELDELLKGSEHPISLLARCVLAKSHGDSESARLFAKSAAMSSGNPALSLPEIGRVRGFLHQLGYFDLSKDLSKSLAQNSSFIVEYSIWLAEDELKTGETEAALLSAESVLLLEPTNRPARRVYAHALSIAGRLEDALVQWEMITRTDTGPESPTLNDWLEYARTALVLNDLAKAAAISDQLIQSNEPDAAIYTLSGDIWMAQGEIQKAIHAYEQALSADPSSEQPWLALAGYYASQGDSAKSIDTLRSGLRSCPDSSELCAMLGDQYASIGAYTDALPYTLHSLEIAPSNVNLVCKAGSMLQLVGKTALALAIYRKALINAPDHPGLLQAYATALLASGDLAAAYEPLLSIVSQKPAQIAPYLDFVTSAIVVYKTRGEIDLHTVQEYLLTGLEIQPDHPMALLLDADLNTLLGLFSQANDAYRSLAESPLLTEDMRWRINYGIGLTSAKLGQVDTALAALEEAGTLNPKNYEIQQKLAETYLSSNLSKAAMDAAQLALSILPDDIGNLLWYSDFCQKSGDIPEAISALQSAIAQQPENLSLLLRLGSLQIQLGETAAAAQTFNRLVEEGKLTPEQVKEAAELLAEGGHVADAIQLLHDSIQKDPAHALALLMDLVTYEKQDGNVLRAVAAIDQAIQMDSHDINLLFQKVDLLAFAGDTSSALDTLQKLLEVSSKPGVSDTVDLSENLAVIHLRIAFLLRKNGDLPGALENAQAALQLGGAEIAVEYLIADLKYNLMDMPSAREHLAGLEETESSISAPITLLSNLIGYELFENQPDDTNLLSVNSSRWQLWVSALALINNPVISRDEITLFEELQGHSCEKIYADLPLTDLHSLRLPAIAPYNLVTSSPTLIYPLINACLTLNLFKSAAWLIGQLEQSYPLDPAVNLYKMKALTCQAENARLFARLLVVAHAPDIQLLSVQNLTEFQDAFAIIHEISEIARVADYWNARGTYAFLPTADNLQAWLAFPKPFDTEFATLQDLINRKDMDQVSAFVAESPLAALQAALQISQTHPESAMEIILPHLETLLQSTDPIQLAMIAVIARESGEDQLSFEALEKALEIWPNETKWHQMAASLSQSQGSITSTKAHLLQAAKLKPDSYEIQYELGKVSLGSDDPVSAIQYFKAAGSIDNSKSELWQALAAAHLKLNDSLQALASIDRAITLAPDLPEPLVISAEISLKNKQVDLAIQKADAALRISPEHPGALIIKIKALRSKSHNETALQLIEQNLSRVVDPLPLLLEKAEIIKNKSGVKAYLSEMRRIADQYSSDEKFLKVYAYALAENDLPEEALTIAQQALQQNENQFDLQILAAHMLRATGQLDQALDHVSHAMNIENSNMDGYLEMAHIYEERRDYVKAATVYHQAIEALPLDYRPYYYLGLAMKDSKDYIGAEAMLRKAAELSNEDVAVLRQLGAIIAINLVHRA